MDRLERYDQNGNLTFLYWDDETTAARALEYDSLGRLIRQTDAHCNAGCGEWIYEYHPGLTRMFSFDWLDEDTIDFPREEAFSTILRNVHDAGALQALAEISALRQTTPRLEEEEFMDSTGRAMRRIDYDHWGDTLTTLFQYDTQGRKVSEVAFGHRGDTTRVVFDYSDSCEEASHEYRTSTQLHTWKFGRASMSADVYRSCNEYGNTVREILVDTTGGKRDTVLRTETTYLTNNKPVARWSDEYGPGMMLQESLEYDTKGNLRKQIFYSPGGPAHMTRTYTCNRRGERTIEIVEEDFRGKKTLRYKYEYW